MRWSGVVVPPGRHHTKGCRSIRISPLHHHPRQHADLFARSSNAANAGEDSRSRGNGRAAMISALTAARRSGRIAPMGAANAATIIGATRAINDRLDTLSLTSCQYVRIPQTGG
jgi:hypothetical protein